VPVSSRTVLHTLGSGSTDPTAKAATAHRPQPANGTIIDAASERPVASVRADGPITAATADGAGGWFIAGPFTAVDGVARANLADVQADGTLNAHWRGPRLGPAAALSFLSLARAGTRVLVAGGFTAAGHRRPGVVALRASDGSLDPTWTTPRECSDGDWEVRARSGRAFVATACAAPPCLVALAAADGRPLRWPAGIAAIGETGCVNDIAFDRGIVYFTGGFTAVGGRPRNGIAAARAAASGTQLWAWPRRGDATTNVLLAVSGRVYVGGAFGQIAGAEADGLAALDGRTGRPVAAWHPGPGSEIFALSASGNRILIGAE
jgi:hypothetical protein